MALLAYTEESMSAGVDGEKSNLNKKFLEQTESLIRKHIDGSPPEVSFSVSRESIQDFYDSFNLADHEGKAQMLGFNHDLSPKMLARFESVMKRNI